ncbi:MAG: hypothetical protein J0I70_05130, partial [Microbacterium sp.]|uniref:hypothetical protein n=1 Tax=Microbacterium sp. TaxID=51671 RepID=UPI001ACB99DA
MDTSTPLQQWVGRTREAEDIVTPRLLASFAAMLGPDAVQTAGGPPGLHWCLAPDIAGVLVSELACRVRTYPWRTRAGSVAGNLRLDTRHAVLAEFIGVKIF